MPSIDVSAWRRQQIAAAGQSREPGCAAGDTERERCRKSGLLASGAWEDGIHRAAAGELAFSLPSALHAGSRRVEVEAAAQQLVVGASQVGHHLARVVRREGGLGVQAPIAPVVPAASPAVPHGLQGLRAGTAGDLQKRAAECAASAR